MRLRLPLVVISLMVAAATAAEHRVLCIGNSLTFSNEGLDASIAGFAQADGADWEVSRRAEPGWSLDQHLADPDTMAAIEDPAGWDAILIQDFSNRPIEDPIGFARDARQMIDLARGVGAKPYLLMTWAYAEDLQMTLPLARGYTAVGHEAGCGVAPAGLAFHRARLDPDNHMLIDYVHPTTEGTFLAAATAYGRISGADVATTPYAGPLDQDTASTLRQIAADTLTGYNEPPLNRSRPSGATASPLGHLVYLPIGYASMSDTEFPLLLYLAGYGERGNGTEPGLTRAMERHGPPSLIAGADPAYPKGRHFRGVVLSPQQSGIWQVDDIDAFVDYALATYRIDPSRIYITGLSDGASAIWKFVQLRPGLAAAVAPMATPDPPGQAHALAGIDAWAFHNFYDGSYPYRGSATAMARMAGATLGTDESDPMSGYPHAGGDPDQAAAEPFLASFAAQRRWTWSAGSGGSGGDDDDPADALRLTIYPNSGHDCWTRAWTHEPLWDWIFARRRASGAEPKVVAVGADLEAEHYDLGGPAVGYRDADQANLGGQYRSDGVDLERCVDGGYNVGWTGPDEWLAYTVTLHSDAGLALRVARPWSDPGFLTVEVAGAQRTVEVAGTGGWQAWTTLPVDGLTVPAGTHRLVVRFEGYGVNLDRLVITSPPSDDAPTYGNHGAPWPLADGAVVEAEDYDVSGPGLAYVDADAGNNGGRYRSDQVDLEACSDAGGGFNVGWIESGEWLAYTVEADQPLQLEVGARVARAYGSGPALDIEIAGLTRTVAVPTTGGWQQWDTCWTSMLDLPAGRHQLRVKLRTGGLNLNRLTFRTNATGAPTYGNGGQAWPLADGIAIEAEDYDTDGPGAAYADDDPENRGGKYRGDGVDLESCADIGGGFNVGWIRPGEWLGYSVSTDEERIYEIQARVARAYGSDGAIRIEVAGTQLDAPVPPTGGWQAWSTITIGQLAVPIGDWRLLVAAPEGDWNLNRIVFEPVPSAAQ